jgi:hypothetical protein
MPIDSIFDKSGSLDRRHHDRRLDQEKQPVERAQDGFCPFAFHADDDALRPHEIADSAALAQKFGIGG